MCADGRCRRLPGDATGAFPTAQTIALAVGSAPSDVTIAELTGDARNDLAVSERGLDTVLILSNDSSSLLSASHFPDHQLIARPQIASLGCPAIAVHGVNGFEDVVFSRIGT